MSENDSKSTKTTIAQVVEEIRKALASEGQMDVGVLRGLAEAYNAACTDVANRANTCQGFVSEGLRAEAEREAKKVPDLRAEFETVCFIELPAWYTVCEKLELSTPPLLDTTEIGDIIKDVYSKSPTVDRLLGTHRKMARGRAPLVERLRVMRHLRTERPGDGFWEADIRTFEKARMDELVREIERAAELGDLDALENALSELGNDKWLGKPTSRLLKGAEAVAKPLRQRAAIARFSDLLPQLRQAHAVMDEQLCQQLMGGWDAIINETGFSPHPEMDQDITPIRSWLEELNAAREEENAFKEACASLELAIDEDKDMAAAGTDAS
jgi:hypothetical protein